MRRLFVVAIIVAALTCPSPAAAESPVNQWVDIVFVGAQAGVVTARGAIDAVGVVTEENTLHPDGTFHGTLRFQFLLAR